MTDLTQSKLQELLSYDPNSGIFRWKVMAKNGLPAGSVAGTKKPKGYIAIGVNGRLYRAHNLAWLYVYGAWPKGVLDHVNRVTSDNRIANLRESTPSQNQFNRGKPSNNSTGYKGVCWDAQRRKFQAGIGINRKRISLGRFDTAEEAYAAYCEAAKRIHGEFAHP